MPASNSMLCVAWHKCGLILSNGDPMKAFVKSTKRNNLLTKKGLAGVILKPMNLRQNSFIILPLYHFKGLLCFILRLTTV